MKSHQVSAYGAKSAITPLVPLSIPRRDPQHNDVQIDILFCGVCHSDLHSVRDEWNRFMPTTFPIVPGHEIVGRVRAVGGGVKRYSPGDLVAVGCLVDSDRTCTECRAGYENNCANGIFTFNGPDNHLGGVTYGGYSSEIIVDENFVLRVPGNLDLAGAAPLLCAGITTYSPLRHWKIGPGSKVGIVGLGGLGHMGVKLARAMGAEVTVLTTSSSKTKDALRLGAADVINTKDADALTRNRGRFDFLLDTVSADHNIDVLLSLLRREGHLTLVGAPSNPLHVDSFSLIMGRKSFSGSLIGGIAETQEMLDFCGHHGITADVEVIPATRINEAYERLIHSDVKYRFCIDISTLRS